MRRFTALRGLLGILCACALATGLSAPAWAAPGDDASDDPVLQRALRSGQPLTGWRIALDPGHNGGNADDPAAVSHLVSDGRGDLKTCNTTGTATASGYPEHAFTLDVAERLAARLEKLGATVLLTREDDDGVGPCVDVRGRFAEDVDADLMVSIHANGSASPQAHGYFAIVSDPAISPSQGRPSLDLAEDLLAALDEGGFTPSNTVADALQRRSDLATLNFARRPAVMLELGEMRNPDEAAVMETEDGREAYADAIARGILTYASDHERRER